MIDMNQKDVLSLKYREYPDFCVKIPLDWSLDPYTNNNWCHNFYSLRWIPSYIQQWIKNDRKGLNPLLCIQDFLEYHAIDENKKNNFYMSKLADHTMSERLEVLSNVYLELTACNTDYEVVDKELLKNELIKLVGVLLSDNVYRKNSNHGFMIDMELIKLALKLPELDSDNKVLNMAERRIELQMDAMFDQYGINKEHSISYQEFDAALCVDLLGIYKKYNRTTLLLTRIYSIVTTSFHFLKYCVKPNGENHRIGDTFAYPNQRLIKKIESAYLEIPNKYKEKIESLFGVSEKNGLLIAPEAGFSIIRYAYGKDKTTETFHLFFTAAWHSYIHKQNDDLSFSLYVDGFNIIEDPGYSDAINDRSYRSEYIHNTHTCEGYDWRKETFVDRKNTKLFKFYQSDTIYAIQATHHRIENLHIERTLIYLLPKILLVVDYFEIKDKNTRNIKTRFNLGENIQELNKTSNGYEINVNNKIKSIIQKGSNEVIQSIDEAFILNRNGSKMQSKSILFSNIINNNDTIVTIIDLSEENKKIEVTRYSASEFELDINGKKEKISLEDLKKDLYFNSYIKLETDPKMYSYSVQKREIAISNVGLMFKDVNSYAKFPDIIFDADAKWKLKIHFQEYQNDKTLNFFFGERGSRYHGFARVNHKIFYRLGNGSYVGGLPYVVGNYIQLTVSYDDGDWVFSDGENSIEVQEKTDVIFNAIGSAFNGKEFEEKTGIEYVEIQEYSEKERTYKDVGIWKLNENRGCIAFDSSGNQHHAVLINTKWKDFTNNELIIGSYPLAQEDWQQYTQTKPKQKFAFLDKVYNKEKDLFLWKSIEAGLNDFNWKKGEKLLKNIYDFKRFEPVKLPSILTWKENPLNNRSWQWQLHQFIFYIDLLAAHRKTKKSKYLDKLVGLLTSWYNHNYTKEYPSKMSWNDHTTALRLRSLIYIWEYLRNSEYEMTQDFSNMFLNVINTHCNVLSSEKFYMKYNNHGFDQSLYLYLASVTFTEFENSKEWHAIAFDRLMDEIGIAFTSEGIHVENSPSYLVGMLQRVDTVSKMIQHYEEENNIELTDIINNALKALAYLIHPNGTLPMLGDTDHATRIPALNHLKNNANFKLFEYVHSQAQRGIVEDHLCDVVFEESGYAVFRDKWHDKETYTEMIHLVFKCGFLSTFHRHDDDLNFVLHGLGEEWFVDGGIYKYDEEDKYRKYLRSAKAHNIPVIANTEVSRLISKDLDKQSKIANYFLSEETSWVEAKSFMYTGYCVTRKIEYIRPNRFIITDKVDADTKELTPYELMFHIPMDKKIEIKDDNSIYIYSQNSSKLHMLFDGECSYSFELLSGEDNEEVIGWQSKVFGKINTVQTLRCSVMPKHNKAYSMVEMTLRKKI